MIERTTPIGPEPTVALEGTGGTVTIDGRTAEVESWKARVGPSPLREAYQGWRRNRWPRGQSTPVADILTLRQRMRRYSVGIDWGQAGGDRAVETLALPMVDPKGNAVEWPSSGWLPLPVDDAVAMLVETRHTPTAQIVRGRECWYAGAIDVLLMPFGKGTLVGPRTWVIAASEQLDEEHYARWGEEWGKP